MKILLFTDNHYSQYSSIVRKRGKKYSMRLENQIDSLNWVEKLSDEEKCDITICLGDFFDKPELNAEELTALRDIKWNTSIPHYFIVGNHEMGSNDLKYNSTNALEAIGEVIDKPKLIDIDKCILILIPYILETNREPLEHYLSNLGIEKNNLKNTVILSHNDIAGIRFGQFVSKTGFKIDDIESNCDLYINGHLHNQQQVSDKILNLGNLTGQNFSEDAFKYSHCAGILDTDKLEIRLINNPYAFNFYKLDFTNDIDIEETLTKCKNGIVSIKLYEKDLTIVKELLDKLGIIESRIMIIPNSSLSTNEIKEFTKLDHIAQFKQYVLDNTQCTEILKEELSII